MYGKVTEKQSGKGKTVYEYSMPATDNQTTTTDYPAPYNYTATKSKVARLKLNGSCPASGIIKNGYYTYPFPNNTNYDFERGLLLNKKEYNENGDLVNEVQYTYQRISKAANPYIIKGIKMESFNLNTKLFYVFGQYKLLTDVDVVAKEKNIFIDPSDPLKKIETTTSYYYESPNHKYLSRITSTGSAGVISQKEIKYIADYTPFTGTPIGNVISVMKEMNKKALPVEEIYSVVKPSEGEIVTGAKLIKYQTEELVFGPPIVTYPIAYPIQQLELRLSDPIPVSGTSAFVPSNTSSSGEGFIYDPRYELTTSYVRQHGFPIEIRGDRKNVKSFVLDDYKRVVAEIDNSGISEVAFSGFTKPVATAPVSGKQNKATAITLTTSEQLNKTDIKKNLLNTNYTFSCWIKSPENGTLTVTLTDVNDHSISKTINYSNTNNTWMFYKIAIPVATLGATFDAQ